MKRRKRKTIAVFLVVALIILVCRSYLGIQQAIVEDAVNRVPTKSNNHTTAIVKRSDAIHGQLNLNSKPEDAPVTKSSFLFAKNDPGFRPTTKLPEKDCKISASRQAPKRIPVDSFRTNPNYEFRTLSQLTTLRGTIDTPLAICRYDSDRGNHLPHVMQHFYACYSFWQENNSKKPALYIEGGESAKSKMERLFSGNPFLKGFLELLMDRIGLLVVTDDELQDWLLSNSETSKTTNSIDFRFADIQSPVGYVLSHVHGLNQMAEDHLGIFARESMPAAALRSCPQHGARANTPRIGILNRKPSNGRSITNAETLVRRIASEFFKNHDNENDAANLDDLPVSLTYFEGLDFSQQVRFFQTIDILIAPHGAQLSGLPFLADRIPHCAQLLEVFPHRYLLPDFFGTLAESAGIGYSYLYEGFSKNDSGNSGTSSLGNNYEGMDRGRIVPSDYGERVFAKKQNLCVDPSVIVEAVEEMLANWCECQDQNSNS